LSKDKKAVRGLYLIVDDTPGPDERGWEDIAGAGIAGGAEVVQLRGKSMTTWELYGVALRLRKMTEQSGALFIVNDSVELAIASHADGVHLGQDDMPIDIARRLLGDGAIIGVSTHSVEQAQAAEASGADYIGYGPIYPTTSKDAGTPKGPDGIKEVRGKVKVPIVAIGGISTNNAREAIGAGADAVAVISAVSCADDMVEAARAIAECF
jgi:thiamine-phosphate diphosphorylase